MNVFFQNIIENGGSPENRWIYSANSCRNWITSLGNGFDNTTMNSIEASKLIICKQLNRDGVKGDICSNDRLLGKQICVQLHVGTKSRCLFSGMCIYHVYWYLNMQTEHYCIDYAFSPFQQWRVLSALFCFINFRQIPIAATSFCNLVFRDNSVPFLTFVLQ